MEMFMRATDTLKSIRETRLSALRSPMEFFDYHRFSKPANMNDATSRVSYNTRYFSGNYAIIVAMLAVWALITNYWLIFAIIFLVGGFTLINRYAPDATQFGEHTVTQKHLYIGLFVIGIPVLLYASPLGTFFWIAGASGCVIIAHACLMEPGIESEYAAVEEGPGV